MREIYIAGETFNSCYSYYKSSLVRRAPYRNNYVCRLLYSASCYRSSFFSNAYTPRFFNTTQLKICKVS